MTTTERIDEDADDLTRDGRGLRILLGSDDTRGALALVDCAVPAGASGPPLHVHPGSDETFVVVSGRLLVHLHDTVREVRAGEVVHVPRGSAHTFATPVEEGAHFLAVHTPGGFERFHAAAAHAEREQGEPLRVDRLIALARDFDWALAGPPLLPTGVLAPRP